MQSARGEFVKCCFNVVNNLKMCDAVEAERKKQRKALYWEKLMAEKLDETLYKPRKDIECWNTWLLDSKKRLLRQKFFVFSGDSRLGKTEFVKQSVEGGVFIATCSKASEPDLRDYEGPPEEKTILYDEASPQMVSDHRDLFQAPRHEVTLGHSDTNCYAYKVKVWQVRMVVCTNNWEEQLNAMQVDKDREWLIKNSVVYNVTEELFRKEDGVLESEAT